ncbi:hypothetical protein UFOVP325_49 [uncultured Caudovirales phage]|jgi:hypothetical protein|uniref:Uncharacterized protein n=1 Tax=uncultured Caudovirales phage TaxID=2100421 RepID=A0A6J5MNZ0_9CAUD|nr:hypothetical protein UFOVP325_49 [uncultured Caudovirales phage]CAB4147781.1 hypothetical protein UFOVP430_44 [uncultured Caudovirales phage]
MATYSVSIEAYLDVEASDSEEAWTMVNSALSGLFYEVRDKNTAFVDGELTVGEVEELEEN